MATQAGQKAIPQPPTPAALPPLGSLFLPHLRQGTQRSAGGWSWTSAAPIPALLDSALSNTCERKDYAHTLLLSPRSPFLSGHLPTFPSKGIGHIILSLYCGPPLVLQDGLGSPWGSPRLQVSDHSVQLCLQVSGSLTQPQKIKDPILEPGPMP